jgi:hypothetical protein
MAASQNAFRAAAGNFFRISLGFKQLARGLHAGFKIGAAAGFACGDCHPQNKLEA